jgi:predicted ATPase/transcriptional regulator with GAF, ATPase, and Fis domain
METHGYPIRNELARDGPFVLYRCEGTAGASVLVKVPGTPAPHSTAVASLRREHELLAALEIDGLPRGLGFEVQEGALVLEDRGGVPLASLLTAGPLPLGDFFRIAGQLAATIGELHRRGIIHRNLNPLGILVEPATLRTEIIDLSQASRLAPEAQPAGLPQLPAANLSYVSPEQTGRMNRVVDYRSDFYSLGTILHEMLTGRPPFSSPDPLELVHSHVARAPLTPTEVDPGVPEAVSDIVSKLLAKTAEARYQSAWGLKADLDRCASRFREEAAIARFPLGEEDFSDRFTIPQRLYGREREKATLLDAFERAGRGKNALILVSGYSGIGKTSLVHEVHKPMVGRRGRFVSGKFDQLERSTPYSAVLQAFRGLVRQVLAESERETSSLRERLLEALGVNAAVVSAVIPELHLLLGPKPPPAPLPASESQNRFNLALESFLSVLARAEHPLVVFLDDLQWADSASLQLLARLLTSQTVHHLFLIGAYRDNEMTLDHPLMKTLAEIRGTGAEIGEISLPHLARSDVQALVRDTVGATAPDVLGLADLVLLKTGGNPFFATQFLKSLHGEGLITFDHSRRAWTFDLGRIQHARITDNVVDLMTRKLRLLAEPTQEAVTLAACIGSRFSLAMLAVVRQKGRGEVASELWPAIREGLILPAIERYELLMDAPPEVLADAAPAYTFLHDRVQQAAYALIPEGERKPVHLGVGRLLLADHDGQPPAPHLFEVVNHLNFAQELIGDEGERATLARLNLEAGRRARESAAFRAALDYFEAGCRLLARGCWTTDYDLTFALERERAEGQSLCGAFEEAERSFGRLRGRARTKLDQAMVYTLELLHCEGLSRYKDAIRVGREALALFGLTFPDGADERGAALEAERSAIQTLLGRHRIPSLIDLPAMADAETRMVMKLLTNLHTSCFLSGDKLLTLLNTATMVRLSLAHGNCEESAYAYVLYAAMLLVPMQEDFAAAYEFGTLALELNERFPAPALRAKVLMNFGWAVSLFRKPMAASLPLSREAFRLGNENGLFVEASYALFNECWLTLLSGEDLAAFERTASANAEYVRRVKMDHFVAALQTILQWGRALQGRTAGPVSLSDESFDEEAFARHYEGQSLFQMFYLDAKLALLYTFGDHRAACRVAQRAEVVIREFPGTIWDALRVYYHALSLARRHSQGNVEERREAEASLPALRARLAKWAESSPASFGTQHRIVAAEEARILGQEREAIRLFEAAIDAADGQSCPREQALARELYGRFWRDRGQVRAATAFLSAARDAYAQWGAHAKVDDLERSYPELPSRPSTSRGAGGPLDFLTATKAAHAIAREIELDRLLKTLVRIAVENAGAQRGLLLQEHDGRLVVVAEGSLGSWGSLIAPPAPLESRDDLSHAIVHLTHRTGESVLVADAANDARWATDPYVQSARPRSILCVSVIHQGRLKGLLYLENNLAPEAFRSERIEMMEILSAQAAIALENARLYDEMRQEVLRRGAAEKALREALQELEVLKNRLLAENVYLQEEIRTHHNFEEIVGNDPALVAALRKVERVAPTESTVLVYGETGTGKELFARAIHSRSSRRDRALVKVNCGAIPPGLVESELFGHVKGAFTGALQHRTGRFELADRGTLFLDEVSELPPDTQVKLLRVLQEKEFEPVGSSRTVHVDVRLIAASNRRLDEAVRSGSFRADLLYRLNVFPLDVPPLRERKSDIPLLVEFFVGRLAKTLGKDLEGVSRRSMERLQSYSWPGNVRELQNVLERAAILAQGSLVDIDPLSGGPSAEPGSRTLEELERDHIANALKSARGVIEGARGAAALLGLHPNTLRSRMKKLGIVRAPSGL